MSGPRCHPARRIALAVVAVASMLAATACGGDGGGGSGGAVDDADAKPVAGGKAVYGVEADNSGGFCLPEAELAISGWLVAMSVYDPLVYPNADGKMVPYLAESVTPNGDATQWTIRLRDGITFHDGTPLDAETVKLNLDSYRGANPELRPLLAAVIFQEIADVVTTDPRTVVVTTVRPWWAFPSYLFLNGRMGIAARSQLTNRDTCARDLVGTGPFRLKGDWTPGTPIELERNPDYWRTDAAGQRLPYLDQLTFVGVAEQSQRINQLEGSQLQLAHSSQSHDLNKFRELERRSAARVYVAEQGREVHYHLLNAGREPFSDPEAREAFALAVDRDKLNALLNEGNATLANGPFDVGVPGHLDTLEGPAYDPARAEQLVAAVKQRHGGEFHVTFAVNPDQNSQTEAQLLEQQVKEVGIDVTIERVDQSTEINRGLAGDFDVLLWRLHAGEDPDTQYIWWHSRSPTNFNHFADDEIDRDLDEARVTQDADVRREHYEAVNRRFAEQLYNVWAWYVDWAVATNPRVHGVLGPPLPDGSEPYPLLAGLHPTLGLWISR